MWTEIDNDRSFDLTYDEFELGILNHNIRLTQEEIQTLFNEYDANGDGRLEYNEFLNRLRVKIFSFIFTKLDSKKNFNLNQPPLNKTRLNLIRIAFDKLDRLKDGQVTVEDLKTVYSVKKNPKYLNGELTEDQCLRQFLDNFDTESHKDGVITYDEFVNYYAGVSASIDSDAYFDVMMRQAWKLQN